MGARTPAIECRRLERPDDALDVAEHGRIDIIKMRDGTAAMRGTFRPGWRWSVDEKPLLGNPETCPMAHTGYCIAGDLVIRIVTTGEERVIRRRDFFEIPPGHDGYVAGDETCELILFAPPEPAASAS